MDDAQDNKKLEAARKRRWIGYLLYLLTIPVGILSFNFEHSELIVLAWIIPVAIFVNYNKLSKG